MIKKFLVKSRYYLSNNSAYRQITGEDYVDSQDTFNISDRKFTNRETDVLFLNEDNMKVRILKSEIVSIKELVLNKQEVTVNEQEQV